MRGIIIFTIMLIGITLINCGNLVTMPNISIRDIETSSFQDAVNKLVAKYGNRPISFDAIIETKD